MGDGKRVTNYAPLVIFSRECRHRHQVL
uniref:Uncharacterized protein n=1 Tax=Anguilla anguilla TaxID=7936 RepID=A0A0E9Y058_ANGAN